MAEEYLQFLEATNSANSFEEFEEMWVKMGEELEMEGLSKRPSTPTPESKENVNKPSSSSLQEVPIQSYSPAMDSNWPPLQVDEELANFQNVENSILTTFRRKYPQKYQTLEKRIKEPSVVQNIEEQFKLLRNLGERMANDVKQMTIIVNYLEDKLAPEPPKKKSGLQLCSLLLDQCTYTCTL